MKAAVIEALTERLERRRDPEAARLLGELSELDLFTRPEREPEGPFAWVLDPTYPDHLSVFSTDDVAALFAETSFLESFFPAKVEICSICHRPGTARVMLTLAEDPAFQYLCTNGSDGCFDLIIEAFVALLAGDVERYVGAKSLCEMWENLTKKLLN